MVSMLDQSVGSVVTALREKHMLENSIILFMSDNGAKPEGIHANHGSNYPLRGVTSRRFDLMPCTKDDYIFSDEKLALGRSQPEFGGDLESVN